MTREKALRRFLVKEVWPDKILYGSIMLSIAGTLGLLHALITLLVPVDVASDAVPWLADYPIWLTAILSGLTVALGLLAWRRLSVLWGVLGCMTGILSLSLFGIGSLHAIVALVFVLLAAREREHTKERTAKLTRWDWPDKALAASLLMLMAGLAAIAWGLGLMTDSFAWTTGSPLAWGAAQVAAGTLAVVAASFLYNERAPILGVVAALACIATMGAYVLAPALGLAALVAVFLGWREGEFHGAPQSEPPAARASPPRPQ